MMTLKDTLESKSYELKTVYDRRKSFYGKAVVYEKATGEKTLVSYSTPVIRINADGTIDRLWSGYSATTMRHVNDFLHQNGVHDGGKAFWDSLEVAR
jgi:hypothetical protein